MEDVVVSRASRSSRRRTAFAVIAFMGWMSMGAARGNRVEELSRALGKDRNYHVRLQAAEVLGKLKDPRAVPALVRALEDPSQAVRAISIDSLAAIGGEAAIAALRTNRVDDADFVKRRDSLALARIGAGAASRAGASPSVGAATGARPWVEIGGIGAKAKVSPLLQKRLREFVARELEHTPGITFTPSGGATRGSPSGEGYFVDSSITSMNRRSAGVMIEVSCEVSYVVGRLPSRSMAMMTSGGATVQVPSSMMKPERELEAQTDALEHAVKGAHANLVTFFKAQQ